MRIDRKIRLVIAILCILCFTKLIIFLDWLSRCEEDDYGCYFRKTAISDLYQETRYRDRIWDGPALTELEHQAFWIKLQQNKEYPVENAFIQKSPKHLFSNMGKRWQWKWIKERINSTWSFWQNAAQYVSTKYNWTARTKRKILVTPGFLTKTNFAFGHSIKNGGPLGELVQWADLIAGLTVLGHKVMLRHEPILARVLLQSFMTKEKCQSSINLVFSDYIGLETIRQDVREAYKHNFRVLDIYGTEPVFTSAELARQNNVIDRYAYNIPARQFFTLYPSTDDNSFLGFALSKKASSNSTKKNIALIYGKDPEYLKGKSAYLMEVMKYVDELHCTLPFNSIPLLPKSIINHGVMSGEDYQKVINSAKFLIGLGDPIEGPGVLEAISRGTIFMNPKFKPGDNNRLKDKPTLRRLTSQVPYAEKIIGYPHVITLDINNVSDVHEKWRKALTTKVEPFLPFEFTMEGYLQRLNYYLEYQDPCAPEHVHLGLLNSLQVIDSEPGQSCVSACQNKGYLCEPALFLFVNKRSIFDRFQDHCKEVGSSPDLVHPSLNSQSRVCQLQANPDHFSCNSAMRNHIRMCPCRDFIKFQSSLCKECT